MAIYTDTQANEAVVALTFQLSGLSEECSAQGNKLSADMLCVNLSAGTSITIRWYRPRLPCAREALPLKLFQRVSPTMGDGNLLTQAIATSDPDDFGMMRLQFLGARNWSRLKAPSRSTNSVGGAAVLRDFEADALRDMVRADAWAVAHFAEFLTMVEQVTDETFKRLVIVTADRPLTQWIALGTLSSRGNVLSRSASGASCGIR